MQLAGSDTFCYAWDTAAPSADREHLNALRSAITGNCEGSSKVQAIKSLRWLFGYTLPEASAIADAMLKANSY